MNDSHRTSSGSFETSTGTLYVSKPYRSKSSKKLRALITFAPRKSAFDITNESNHSNQFRGFFSLFWISIFIFTVQTYVRSIEANGRPLNLQFAAMFSQDAITLALSDGVLVLTTGICVPFAIALKKNWIQYYWTGVLLQHIIQTSILVMAIVWTFNRQWPWVQAGFLTLHSLVMIMKMHSYITVNGQLQYVRNQSQTLLTQLEKGAEHYGGWDVAISEARQNASRIAAEKEEDSPGTISPTLSNETGTGVGTPVLQGTPFVPEGSTATSYVDAGTAVALRKRLAAVSRSRRKVGASRLGDTSTTAHEDDDTELDGEDPPTVKVGILTQQDSDEDDKLRINHIHSPSLPSSPSARSADVLLTHPSPEIAAMAQDYCEFESELMSAGPEHIKWPKNISWKNYLVYLLIPTLVYELEYPRTDRIRVWYVFEKTVATFGTFALLYTVTESFILPYTPTKDQSFLRSLLDLALPFMMAYLLLFYIIFECICNWFAELSYFADRQFYEDWVWNSTSWDQFSRKWNKPVHAFLLRHVYAATILSYKLSKTSAMLLTFLLSAAAHELVMVVVTHKIRMYLFTLQLIQIPLILVSRLPAIRRNELFGNVVFWLGLYAGFPLLCVAYVAH